MLLCTKVARQEIADGVHDRPLQRHAFDPLRAPFCANLAALDPPDFFRVAAEEGLVQAPAKAIDEEGVEIGLVTPRKRLGPQVTQRDSRRVEQPQAPCHRQGDAQGIWKEMASKVDARKTWSPQHHPIFPLGIRRSKAFLAHTPVELGGQRAQDHLAGEIEVVALLDVVGRGGALRRQNGHPPVEDPSTLREEAMSADVDAVAVVHVGLSDAADGIGRLDDDRMDVGPRQQLPRCGQSGRTCPRDDGNSFLAHRRRDIATRTAARLPVSPICWNCWKKAPAVAHEPT